jgi:anti-anti-sigma factor
MSPDPDDFAMDEARGPAAVTVTLRGDLDVASAPAVSARLAAHRTALEPVILDLDALEFIDSSGLRVILQAVEDSRRDDWSFRITPGSEPVRRLLSAAGLSGRLPMV